jgi:transposase-like protein
MIRKIDLYNQAIILRQSGESIKSIAKKLMISSSTASLWCREIKLTTAQLEKLKSKSVNYELLKALSIKKHLVKVSLDQEIFDKAKNEVKLLTKNEFFVAGIALYWAEGFKNLSEGRIGFCNSDPRMIIFMLRWFKKFLHLGQSDFTLRVEFNAEHLERKEEIEAHWSNITGITLEQFNKPFLQKAKLQKKYPHKQTYFGTLRIRVRKSTAMLPQIRGWIQGLNDKVKNEVYF